MNGWVLLSLDKEGRLSDGAELGTLPHPTLQDSVAMQVDVRRR